MWRTQRPMCCCRSPASSCSCTGPRKIVPCFTAVTHPSLGGHPSPSGDKTSPLLDSDGGAKPVIIANQSPPLAADAARVLAAGGSCELPLSPVAAARAASNALLGRKQRMRSARLGDGPICPRGEVPTPMPLWNPTSSASLKTCRVP